MIQCNTGICVDANANLDTFARYTVVRTNNHHRPREPLMAKGMILAAGQGTRVRPLTKNIPKPMVPILGKPVLEYLIEHLARHGVTQIMINVAFNHYKIENYFGDGHRWGVEIRSEERRVGKECRS